MSHTALRAGASPAACPTTWDDLAGLLAALPGPEAETVAAWAARDPRLTKPAGALGRLEEISRHLSAWQGQHPPRVDHPHARIFAGNHGVAALGVSAFPASVTVQMVANFEHGGAAINQLCALHGMALQVIALDLDQPTDDFTAGPALDEAAFFAAFAAGFASVDPACDLLVIGEMGIGNTTAAAALAHGLFGGAAADWTGRGTGVDDPALARKTDVVAAAIARHGAVGPLQLMAAVGGRELAAMAGATVAARLLRVPVLLDGYVCCAAVAPLAVAQPGALDHCLVGHVSVEPGHRRLLERLGLEALLNLNMRLGEGSGAAVAVGIVRAAVACHSGMATFDQAGVSEKS